jgi:hypothetical protein
MSRFYQIWAVLCAPWGYLAAAIWPEPFVPGAREIAAFLFGVFFVATLVAFAPSHVVPRARPSLELKPWSLPIGLCIFASFTLFASGAWAIAFALIQSVSLFRGALHLLLLGAVLLSGIYLSPVLFRSRYEA